MKNILSKIVYSVIAIILVSVSATNMYALDKFDASINPNEGKNFLDEIFSNASGFKDVAGQNVNAGETLKDSAEKIVSDIGGAVFYIGNFVFFAAAIVLGIKYMLQPSAGKAQIKGGLMSLFLGVVFFYSAQMIFEFTSGAFDEMLGSGSAEHAFGSAFKTFTVIAQCASYAAVLFMGLRYMTAAPRDKARIKSELIPFAIGTMLVFSTATIIRFFSGAGQSIFG